MRTPEAARRHEAAEAIEVTAVRLREVVVSVSGGKDSAAACLHLRELGIPHRRVFADTGWEHPLTYEYLRGELTRVVGPIDEVRGPRGLPDLVRHKGMFPSRTRRFCTQELKLKPLMAYMRALDDEVVNVVGIRAQESRLRASFPEWEWSDDFDALVWRPLLRWTEEDVIAIHHRHGLAPNPLYLRGASRVGCWPCIFARKGEIRFISDEDPRRIDEIRALEMEVDAASLARVLKRQEEALGLEPDVDEDGEARKQRARALRAARKHTAPTFFQAQTHAERGSRWGIDRVVEWSRTVNGGQQYPLIREEEEEGCVRWGMCEAPEPARRRHLPVVAP